MPPGCNAEQRDWLVQRLAAEQKTREHHGFTVLKALSNGTVWQLGLLVFLSISFGQYALTLWPPQIVSGFPGMSNLEIGFISAIPNLVAVVAMVLVANHSDRTGERCLHIAAGSAIAVLGFLGCAIVRSPVIGLVFVSVAFAALLVRTDHSGHFLRNSFPAQRQPGDRAYQFVVKPQRLCRPVRCRSPE